jgi:hypothetical protein
MFMEAFMTADLTLQWFSRKRNRSCAVLVFDLLHIHRI